jgi:hypothetical protein
MNSRCTDYSSKRKPHWYLICRTECALCGRGDAWRERQHTPKPEDPQERHHFRQYACADHFA